MALVLTVRTAQTGEVILRKLDVLNDQNQASTIELWEAYTEIRTPGGTAKFHGYGETASEAVVNLMQDVNQA
jgi:hypothetical protein